MVLQRQVRSRSASFRHRPLPTSPAPHEQQVKERTPRQGTCRHGDPLRVAFSLSPPGLPGPATLLPSNRERCGCSSSAPSQPLLSAFCSQAVSLSVSLSSAPAPSPGGLPWPLRHYLVYFFIERHFVFASCVRAYACFCFFP